jgi:hypothetical protein
VDRGRHSKEIEMRRMEVSKNKAFKIRNQTQARCAAMMYVVKGSGGLEPPCGL